MSERRYSDEEAAEIFRLAAESEHAQPRPVASGQGMTLAGLQEIGREAGLSPELVRHAAGALDRGGSAARLRRFLGLPIGVGKVVELGRHVSDAEWEQLVGDLRETFDARGTIRYDGPFRQWSNGNLHVLLEPTPDGHRLRFRTVKGNSQGLMMAGLASLAGAVGMALFGDAEMLRGAMVLAAMGTGMFGVGAIQLPGWARLRQRQMDALAERLALAPGPIAPADDNPARG